MPNIIKNGQIIRTSKNLRGVCDYARISPVVRIESCDIPAGGATQGGTMRVFFKDGAESRANFASYHVMIDFIRNRRTWRNAKHVRQGPDMGCLTKPGIIAGGVTFNSLALYDTFIFAPMADGSQLSFDIGKRYQKTGVRTYRQIDITGGAIAGAFRVGSIHVEVKPAPEGIKPC